MLARKEEILTKLKKYAKENDNTTPGETVFIEYADITIYDRMKYWSNYGELVREAGLTPNKFDKTKYKYEQLCKLFIKVMRNKNKWPTRGDLDVLHHRDSNFPNSATFYKKLGLSADLAKTIIKFVEDKDGYDDVVSICKSAIEKFGDKEDLSGEDFGYVYLGKRGALYKVGETVDLPRRKVQMETLQPDDFEYLHVIKTDDRKNVEGYWLNRFKKKIVKSEWFKLNSSDIKAFKRWKKIF